MWQFILTGVLLTMISMMAVATITSFFSMIFQSTLMSTCAAFALIIICQNIQSIVIHRQLMTGWLFIGYLLVIYRSFEPIRKLERSSIICFESI